MFERSFQTAFICLRCQSRLLHQQKASPLSVRRQRHKSAARWQSTAVARVEEEDEDIEDPSPEKERDDEAPSHADQDQGQDVKNGTPQTLPKEMTNWWRAETHRFETGYRKFHPDRVAGLGVSSLGKPAEVLVLQPRDRRIPKVPTQDEGENEPQLLESLQAETAPLDPDQVKHNLEQIKKQFGNGGQVLDKAQWKELRHNLVKGFTHVQLLDYIRHIEKSLKRTSQQVLEAANAPSPTSLSPELSRIISEKPDLKKSKKNNIKRRAVVSIMKDIWGYSLPAGEEEGEDVQSVTVPVSLRHISFLGTQEAQALKKIAESLKVKIDIFQQRCQLVIHGSPNAIDQAKEAITSIRSQITTLNVDLRTEKLLLPILREDRYIQRLLDEAGRNKSVYIESKNLKKGALLRILHHRNQRQEAEAARREILLASRRLESESSISIWPPTSATPSTWLVPYTSWQPLSWWESLSSWGRWNFYQRSDPKAKEASPTHEIPTTALAKKVQQKLSTSHLQHRSLSKSGPITLQDIALFGQALFARDVKQKFQSMLEGHQRHEIPHTLGPRMVTDVPMLAQSLASCKPWSVSSRDSTDHRMLSASTRRYLHHLLLLPATAKSSLPALQVYLTGEDAHLGLRQPLQVHSISAILEERSHIVLLPDRVVDLNFRRQILFHIYSANRKRESKYEQFNGQFLRYLNQAQGKEIPMFAPSVSLSLPVQIAECFQNSGSTPSWTSRDIEAPPENADSPGNASSAPTASVKETRKEGAIEYLLAASETVEAASFSHNVATGLCLDHVHFSSLDGTQSRQELRLAERPYSDPQDASTQLSNLVDGAYGVASWLGDPKVLKEKT